MIAGLNLAKIMEARQIIVFSDSQLIINQILGIYAAKGELMIKYHAKVMELVSEFAAIQLVRIPRMENARADALARLASATRTKLRRIIPIEVLASQSIDEDLTMNFITLDLGPSWMDPIRAYIEEGELPEDKLAAKKLKFKAARYVLTNGVLYRRGIMVGLQRCVHPSEVKELIEEIHEGSCGAHVAGRTLLQRVMTQGYFWPTMRADCIAYAKRCDKCQRFSSIRRTPQALLTPITSPWPFAMWGIDLVVLLPTTRGRFKYLVVVVDYFTKWVEAEPLIDMTYEKVY